MWKCRRDADPHVSYYAIARDNHFQEIIFDQKYTEQFLMRRVERDPKATLYWTVVESHVARRFERLMEKGRRTEARQYFANNIVVDKELPVTPTSGGNWRELRPINEPTPDEHCDL